MLPILMLFVDVSDPRLETWLELLYSVQKRFNGNQMEEPGGVRLLFSYLDSPRHLHRMTSVGLAADLKRLPALGFNWVADTVLTWQPSSKEYAKGTAVLTEDVVNSLVRRFLSEGGQEVKEAKPPTPLAVPKRNVERGERRVVPALSSLSLEERLRFVPAVTHESFSEQVFDPTVDVLVFFYSSVGDAGKASKDSAIYVNRCAERFTELGVPTVRVVKLDTSKASTPSTVQIAHVPSLVLFPAFSKEPPYKVFGGKLRVQHLMWWIQDNADREFDLPDLPHLDELEARDYYEQKAALSAEQQLRVAAESERPGRSKKRQKRKEL